MTDETKTDFRTAVLDMGLLFKEMKTKFGVPPAVTMDIVRLQIMYMQQSQQRAQDEPMDVAEVITAEADEEE